MKEISCFYTCDGSELHNLEELRTELRKIDDESFNHHVNDQKNDFATWIAGEFKYKALAKQIAKTQDKNKIIKLLNKKLNSHVHRKKEIITKIKEGILNG